VTTMIVTANDCAPVRAGLRAILARDPDFTLLGEAEDGYGAVLLAEALQPDVLIVDFKMPGLSGPDVAALLRTRAPGVRVLLLAAADDCGPDVANLDVAAGYLAKPSAERHLAEAVHTLARGELYGLSAGAFGH
jgi:DNA-binding NarL/FixJ family response regulator